jgi:hypothetical protein
MLGAGKLFAQDCLKTADESAREAVQEVVKANRGR